MLILAPIGNDAAVTARLLIEAGTFATPDSPLLFFWTLCLWALWRERWVLAGLAGGAALSGLALAAMSPFVDWRGYADAALE